MQGKSAHALWTESFDLSSNGDTICLNQDCHVHQFLQYFFIDYFYFLSIIEALIFASNEHTALY